MSLGVVGFRNLILLLMWLCMLYTCVQMWPEVSMVLLIAIQLILVFETGSPTDPGVGDLARLTGTLGGG